MNSGESFSFVDGHQMDLQYRAEGNCSLVVCNQESCTVYRLLKTDVTNEESVPVDQLISQTNSRCCKIAQYATEVMLPLFGAYMTVPTVTCTNEKLLEKLRILMEPERPAHRRHKHIAECHYMLTMPDHAFLPSHLQNLDTPTYTFEIKRDHPVNKIDHRLDLECSFNRALQAPKSNITFTPHRDSCESQVSLHRCYFCLNKSRKTSIEEITCRYCPQDLYSGNVQSMEKCILHLLEDVNLTRSRVRIFKNGKDLTGSIESIRHLEEILSQDVDHTSGTSSVEEVVKIIVRCLVYKPSAYLPLSYFKENESHSYLPVDSVLAVLENAQSYGWCSIKKIKCAYKLLMNSVNEHPNVLDKLCMEGPYNTGMWSTDKIPSTPAGISQDLLDAFIIVRNHLIFRSCKDCSVLVTLQPSAATLSLSDRTSGIFSIASPSGENFTCQVKIIDLDPKPFSKMETYIKNVESD